MNSNKKSLTFKAVVIMEVATHNTLSDTVERTVVRASRCFFEHNSTLFQKHLDILTTVLSRIWHI